MGSQRFSDSVEHALDAGDLTLSNAAKLMAEFDRAIVLRRSIVEGMDRTLDLARSAFDDDAIDDDASRLQG